MFFDPERDVILLLIRFDEVMTELQYSAGDIEVVVHQIAIVDHDSVAAEQFEEIFRIISTVLDPVFPEPLASFNVNAVDAAENRRVQITDFTCQLRSHALVRVQGEDPFGVDRKIRQRPAPLTGVGFEWMFDDGCAGPLGDFSGSIEAAGVNDENLAGPVADTIQAGRQVRLLVESENDYGHGSQFETPL